MKLYTQHHQPITLTNDVGKGGEATIYNVAEHPDMVAKIYHEPTAAREAKLQAMLANPPEQPATHTAIVWPTALLYQAEQFVGFLMPKINQAEFSSIFDVYNPVRRRVRYPQATKQTLYQVAVALVKTVAAIHAKGHIIGDINESNILVRDEQISTQQNVFGRLWHWLTQGTSSLPLITFVDADSFQIRAESGPVYRSLVAKPEYTPPELHGVQLKEVDRTIEHDNFGVAVLLFQLLMEGHHPFAGVLRGTESVGRVDLYSIRQGLFPYHATPDLTPPPHAPQFGDLAPDLQAAFVRCFVKGHHHPHLRPGAREWEVLLQQALAAFVTCSQGHVYSSHLNHCPQCGLLPLIPKVGRVARPLHSPGGQGQGGHDELAQPLAEVGAETALTLRVFDDLAQRIEGAVAGAVIYLEAGEYRLTKALVIKKSLQLMGAGLDKTVIIGPEVGHVVTIQAVTFVAQGITFQATHEKSDVIHATNTNLTLTECRCCYGHVGIWLQGKSLGLIHQCVIERNHSHGIWLFDQTTSTLIENTCRANKWAGIAYWDEASGTAQQNQCVENLGHGIDVSRQASPTLIENICRANKLTGIMYHNEAKGTAQQNQCVENEWAGIKVSDQASPSLIENICRANKGAGILYSEAASGTAQQNQCVENEWAGIKVSDQASPSLIENICRANKGAGIFYSQAASGTAQQNQCVKNEWAGIKVSDQASSNVIENICRANKGAGITYDGEATGTAQQNECVENGRHGIEVYIRAKSNLIKNICRANKGVGISYHGEATGTIQQNECVENERDGIEVSSQTKPTLIRNMCRANQESGISYYSEVGKTVQQNECVGNEKYGIEVSSQAKPSLIRNICRANKQAGIVYWVEASGTAQQNECVENEEYGIRLFNQAKPTLIQNICRANQKAGIVYGDKSGGTARGNQCMGNGQDKIQVRDEAKPSLKGNIP